MYHQWLEKRNTSISASIARLFAILLASSFLMTAFLTGCAQSKTAASSETEELVSVSGANDVLDGEYQLQDNESFLEDIVASNAYGLYLKLTGEDVVVRLENAYGFAGYNVGPSFTTIDPDTMQLILVGGEPNAGHAGACELEDYGYCALEKIDSLTSIDELNGEEFETTQEGEKILAAAGCFYLPGGLIASHEKGKSVVWGQYQGTYFASGTLRLDTPYYKAKNYGSDKDAPYLFTNGYECAMERTKDGYFIVDLKLLQPGRYLLNDYADGNTHYPIEVI